MYKARQLARILYSVVAIFTVAFRVTMQSCRSYDEVFEFWYELQLSLAR